MPGGMDALALLYFAKIYWLYVLCPHDRRLWIWIWIANFISTASLLADSKIDFNFITRESSYCFSTS